MGLTCLRCGHVCGSPGLTWEPVSSMDAVEAIMTKGALRGIGIDFDWRDWRLHSTSRHPCALSVGILYAFMTRRAQPSARAISHARAQRERVRHARETG
jgi:hypothetical protein